MFVCLYVCMFVCLYVCMFVFLYFCIFVFLYVCIVCPQEYLLTCLHKHHTMELSFLTGILLYIKLDEEEEKVEEEEMTQIERVDKMKLLHEKWGVVQSALKAMSKPFV